MLRFTMNCDMFTRRPQTIASRKKGWHILHVQVMCKGAITRAAMMSKLMLTRPPILQVNLQMSQFPRTKHNAQKNTTMYVGIQIEKKYTFTDMQNC